MTNGRFAGGIVTVLEVAYEAPGTQHGTTQTVEEALHQLAIANEIQSVKAPNAVTVNSGTDPSSQFPEQVTATYGDGHTADVDVTWAKPEEAKYKDRKGGSFTVHGRIDGFTKGVDITVNVNAATVKIVEQPQDVTIKVGEKLALPQVLNVTWSNGETSQAQPNWDTSKVDTTKAGGPYDVTATVEGKTVTVKVTVVEASIESVKAPEAVTVASGTSVDDLKAKLPTSVEASYDNNTTGNVPVTWAEPSAANEQTLKARDGGKFTLNGTVKGTDKTVTVTVKVTAATPKSAALKDADKTVTTSSGTAPKLPEKATVTWSNGDTSDEPVTWDNLTKEQQETLASRAGGTFQVNGTARGKTVVVTVTVKPATPTKVTTDTVEITTQVGTAPVLPDTLPVLWSNGETTDEPVTWDEVKAEQYAKAGSFEVAGTVNVADTAVPATAGGAAVTPSLRVALRAAKAGEPVGTTFQVTAKVTVTDKQVTPSEEPNQPTDATTPASDKGIKGAVRSLARAGGSLLLLPLAAGLVAGGAILVRRRQA